MGDVYRALDVALARPVALKLLRLELMRRRAVPRADAPRIAARRRARPPECDPDLRGGRGGRPPFHRDALRRRSPTCGRCSVARAGSNPTRAVRIAAQVADALDAAHERGLVHRDVKASNVLVDQPGQREHCYLADFGLTQSASDTGPTDGQFMGTVDYVAPEQIRGDDLDGRADQYALGCLLFELLTGTLPFTPGSEVATVFAHLQEPPPRASCAERPDLPAGSRRACCSGRSRRIRRSATTAAASSSTPQRRRSASPPAQRPARRLQRAAASWPGCWRRRDRGDRGRRS